VEEGECRVEKNIDLTERTLALYQVNTVMSKENG